MQEIPWYLIYAFLSCDEVDNILKAFPAPKGGSVSEVDHRCRTTVVTVPGTACNVDFMDLLTAYPAVKVLNVIDLHCEDLLLKLSNALSKSECEGVNLVVNSWSGGIHNRDSEAGELCESRLWEAVANVAVWSLILSDCLASGTVLVSSISKYPALQSLFISDCMNLDDGSLETILKDTPNLVELRIRAAMLLRAPGARPRPGRGQRGEQICTCPSLRFLSISECYRFCSISCIQLGIHNLEICDINATAVSVSCLKEIVDNNGNLDTLCACACTALHSNSDLTLCSPSLKKLTISRVFSPRGLRVVTDDCPHLEDCVITA